MIELAIILEYFRSDDLINILKIQTGMNFCPCLQTILKKFKKNKKKRSSYEGAIEFQEEEFINPPKQNEPNLDDNIPPTIQQPTPNHTQPQQPSHTPQTKLKYENVPLNYEQKDLLNYKMQFSPSKQDKLLKQQKKEERSIEQLLKEELQGSSSLKLQVTAVASTNGQIFEDFSQHIMYQSFAINIDPLEPHYNLLAQKTHRITNIFDKSGQKMQVGFPNKSSLQIYLLQNSKTNNYIIKYKLNCSYQFYLSSIKSEKAIKGFSKLISQAKTIEAFKPNLTLNTIKFNKMGSFQARDCYYVKYQNGGKRQHWQVYINSEQGQSGSTYKTCEIFCIKNIRERSERQLIINQYIECDFQSNNIGSILPKIANELKNYLNAFQDHIDQNYEQQSA